MLPILFHIPWVNWPIYSYGLMLMLSMSVGWFLILHLAQKDGMNKDLMSNNFIITACVAMLGARLLYVATNLEDVTSLFSIIDPRRGLVAYGGFLGGLLGSFLFLRWYRLPLLPWADVAVFGLASGLMITRIGCYLFGCDFGRPLSPDAPAFLVSLGTFPHWSADIIKEIGVGSPAWAQHIKSYTLSPQSNISLPVHPTQIYESLLGLALLLLLFWARKRRQFKGQIFFVFAYAYGVGRYLLEILRDDHDRGSLWLSLPAEILLPIGLFIFALGFYFSFSYMIQTKHFRLLFRVLAFFPIPLLYFILHGQSINWTRTIQFSTSQFIAIVTGALASLAYLYFSKKSLPPI